MPIVPETRAGKIRFYTTCLPVWAEAPASIGVTPGAVGVLGDLLDEAREAYQAHQAAQQAARSATLRYHQAVQRLHAGPGGGAALIQQIKAFAQQSCDASVYTRAQIPAPAAPGRPGSLGPPGQPYGFSTTVRQTGEVALAWKCDHPAGSVGTVYHVRRSVRRTGETDAGPFEMVGTVGGAKKILDRGVPAGAAEVTYEVTALRSTRRGPVAMHLMRFGGAGGGGAERDGQQLPLFQSRTRTLVA